MPVSENMASTPTLELVTERKICELVSCDKSTDRWEASGILVKGSIYYVAFDDRTEIGLISDDLKPNIKNRLCGMSNGVFRGFEGITYNTAKQRYYLLVESRKHSKGCYKATIVEYDNEFHYLKERVVDFTFQSDNKGFEAVTYVCRDGKDFLLALCEGNK